MRLMFYNTETNKFDRPMATKKTLNEHLFEVLDRLSSADENNIKVEVEKASNIVMVSEQILSVARLKLEIMQAGTTLTEFAEIDKVKESSNENHNLLEDEHETTEDELIDYGGKLISKKTLGQHKATHSSQLDS